MSFEATAAAEFVEHMVATEGARWRSAPVEELRQEAWAAVLEHGNDPAAVRRGWRRLTRGVSVPTVGSVRSSRDGTGPATGWQLDWVPEPSAPPERPYVPTELVDSKALALVEAVMLDGEDFEQARDALGLNDRRAQRAMRAAGLTTDGRRSRSGSTVEGLAAYTKRTRPVWRADFAAIAHEMGLSVTHAEQLICRWERRGVIDLNRTGTGRRQFDAVNIAGLMVLGQAHKVVAGYNRAGARDGMPANWPQLARVLGSQARHVRFTPGEDLWLNGWASHGRGKPLLQSKGEHRIALRNIRNRAKRIACPDSDRNPVRCACGCGRPLEGYNRSGIANGSKSGKHA